MAQKTSAVCRRSDLPGTQRKSIQEAIEILFQRHVKNGSEKTKEINRWSDFAKALKESLDKFCEPHWHIIVGKEVGFACKKRDKTMGVWRIENCTVVIWKSPGIEPPPDAADLNTSPENVEDAPEGLAIRVLEPNSVEKDSEIATVVAELKAESKVTPVKESEQFSQKLRKRLTKELGTIWHVVVGTEFIVEMGVDRRNYVLATVGKMRVICFQHEQLVKSKVEWDRIMKSLPYLLGVLFCFGYMGLNYVCGNDFTPTTSVGVSMQKRFCGGEWENNIGYVGAVAISALLVGKTMNKVAKRKTETIA